MFSCSHSLTLARNISTTDVCRATFVRSTSSPSPDFVIQLADVDRSEATIPLKYYVMSIDTLVSERPSYPQPAFPIQLPKRLRRQRLYVCSTAALRTTMPHLQATWDAQKLASEDGGGSWMNFGCCLVVLSRHALTKRSPCRTALALLTLLMRTKDKEPELSLRPLLMRKLLLSDPFG